MSEQVTQGDAIGIFMELYWDDLTPEQINYLGQTQDEVYLLETRLKRLRELLEYAGGILAHGTPGSAWMDWVLRVQGQLGIEFHNARFEDGHKIPFRRLEERVAHMPKVYLRELKEGEPDARPQP